MGSRKHERWTRAGVYAGITLAFSVFYITILAVSAGSMNHFTDWTLAAHCVFLVALTYVATDYAMNKSQTKNGMFSVFLFVWVLPSLIATETAVAIGSFVVEEIGDIARDALKDYSKILVWSYNAVEHYLTLLALIGLVIFDFGFFSARLRAAMSKRSTFLDRTTSLLMSLLFFLVYTCFFDVGAIYDITWRMEWVYLGASTIMCMSFVGFWVVVDYYMIGQEQTRRTQ